MGIIKQFADYIEEVTEDDSKDIALTYGVQKMNYSKYSSTEEFLHLLGYEQVESVDVLSKESPTIIHDLNTEIPDNLRNRYSLVLDSGTLEHCFDVKEVLYNTVKFLKVGGRVIHINPYNDFIRHGFFQFTENLYYDFYDVNGFGDFNMRIVKNKNNAKLVCFTSIKMEEKEPEVPIQGRYKR